MVGRKGRRSFGWIRKLPSGYHQASYVADDGIRYLAPRTFTARIDAEAWIAAERRLLELGVWLPPRERDTATEGRIRFADFAATWLNERDLTPATRAMYRDLLDSRILPSLGDEYLTALTPPRIRTWFAGLGSATPTRTAHAYQLLRAILNTAADDRLIAENPCKIKSAGRPPKRRTLQILTADEIDATARRMPESYRCAVLVAAWGALRFGELIELRRKDVARVDGTLVLQIRRAATLVDGKIVVGTPKTDAGTRDVHLPPHIATQLDEHMRRFTGRGSDSFLFRTTRGNRLSQSAVNKSFKAALPDHRKSARIHDLRHSGAVLAAQAGATTRELMGRLGHTTPTQAMHYQHIVEGRDALLADAMSRLAGAE